MAYLSHYLHYGIGFHLQNKEINSVFTNQSKPAHSTHVHTPLVPIPSTKTNKLKEMGEEISTGFNLCINRYIYRVYCLNRTFTQPFR